MSKVELSKEECSAILEGIAQVRKQLEVAVHQGDFMGADDARDRLLGLYAALDVSAVLCHIKTAA